MAILDKLTGPDKGAFGELADFTFSTTLSVPDGVGGSRPPTLAEITALELSVYLVEGTTLTYITAWTFSAGTWAVGATVLKNVDIKNTGRGSYSQTTGLLTVTLRAGDNPCISTATAPGLTETHHAHVTGRFNADAGQLYKIAEYKVRNYNKVPREP